MMRWMSEHSLGRVGRICYVPVVSLQEKNILRGTGIKVLTNKGTYRRAGA